MDNPVASVSWSRSRTKAKRCVESFGPDYIVMDILSRLQLKIVLQCRCVCKRWRDLLSTPEFVVLHKQRGMGGNVQMILVDEPKIKRRVDQFFIDNWRLPARKNPIKKSIIRRIHSYPMYRTEFSQDGFLVMTSVCWHSILIVNPNESHGVKILCPDRSLYVTNVYGIYFNPRLKEHRVLLGLWIPPRFRDDRQPYIDYRILTLGAKPRWTYVRNPWNYEAQFQWSTRERARPVFVGECLYWLVVPNGLSGMCQYEDLMEFNTRTEEFTLIQNLPKRSDTGLLNIDGFVSLVHIITSINNVNIDIWTLKDRVAESWTNSMYFVSLGVVPSIWCESFKPIAVECGQLIFQYETTLYACKLKGGKTRICGRKKHNKDTRFFSHSISLVSLKNCKPVICMEGVDEKTYNENCKVCGTLDKEETYGSNAGLSKHSEHATSYGDDGKNLDTEGAGGSTYMH